MDSRKEISQWLRSLPYSQNLSDGLLFCKVLQKIYPAYFLRLNETPKSEYECQSNFKMLNRCLDKNGLYKIVDLDKFANSKDFFEFCCWLKSFQEKSQPNLYATQPIKKEELQIPRSPPMNRVKTAVSINGSSRKDDLDFLAASTKDIRNFLQNDYVKREESTKKINEQSEPRSSLAKVSSSAVQSQILALAVPIDFYEVYQNDVKSLLQLNALESDIEYMGSTLTELRRAVLASTSVESLKHIMALRLQYNENK